VYLFSPAKKRGQCSKFLTPWAGPYKVVARLSKLDYHVMNLQAKEFVVHIKRLKRAYNQGIWKAKGKQSCYRKQQTRRQESDEDGTAVLAPGPITIPAPQVDNQQPDPVTPNRSPLRLLDTPATEPRSLDDPGSHRIDPNYVPPSTPRSRRELRTTRPQPPVTRLQTRMQALQEALEESDD
jgi:hypothetical protein